MPDVNHWRDDRLYKRWRFKASQKRRTANNGQRLAAERRDAERKRQRLDEARRLYAQE